MHNLIHNQQVINRSITDLIECSVVAKPNKLMKHRNHAKSCMGKAFNAHQAQRGTKFTDRKKRQKSDYRKHKVCYDG